MAGTSLVTLAEGKTTIRWREPYVSDGLNRKFHGPIPRGVVRGGSLVAGGGAMSVQIVPDSDTGDSVYTYSNADGRQVTVREIGTITLNLNVGAVPGTVIYIGLKVTYTTSSNTVAEWVAYPEADIDADDKIVVLGRVDVPGAGIIPAANVTPDRRRDAWQDRSVGMRDWRQIAEAGDVDVPAAGKAAGRPFPIWLATATGSATVEHSDTWKRSLTHSMRLGGTSGVVTIAPSAGDGVNTVRYPVKAGTRLMYSFYALESPPWTFDTTQQISFDFYSDLTSAAPSSTVDKPFANPAMVAMWDLVTGVVDVPADGWMSWSIVSQADAANAGYLYIDDIRMWVESGNALDDQGQASLMGVNRQITGSALTLLPVLPPDDVKTWADSAIRTFNTSPADASAISMKTTADPINGVALFDWTIEADPAITGATTMTPPSGVKPLVATADSETAIEGVVITDSLDYGVYGHGGAAGVRGFNDGTGRVRPPVGVVGVGQNPELGFEAIGGAFVGLGGGTPAEPCIGVVGSGAGLSAAYGVFGVGTVFTVYPTVVGAGGVFWASDAVEALVAESLNAGLAGIANTGVGGVFYSETNNAVYAVSNQNHAVYGRSDVDTGAGFYGFSNRASGYGGLFQNNTAPAVNWYDAAGIYARSSGGNAIVARQTNSGGQALRAEGKHAATIYTYCERSYGIQAVSGVGTLGSHAVVGQCSRSSPGGVNYAGVYGEHAAYGPGVKGTVLATGGSGVGGAFTNEQADTSYFSLALGSGIWFAAGGAGPDTAVNPAPTHAISNCLFGANICKMWASIRTGGGGPTVGSTGFNIASAVYNGSRVDVTFGSPLLTKYAVSLTLGGTGTQISNIVGKTTTGFQVEVYNNVGALIDLSSNIFDLDLIVFGAQSPSLFPY